MQKHTKIYYKAMGYDFCDFVPCEVCQKEAVSIHHIECRGMGGRKGKDTIENLQALCMECHVEFGDKTKYKEYLKSIHLKKLKARCLPKVKS